MKQAELDKLAKVLEAKKRLEQSRYQQIKQSQKRLHAAAGDLRQDARQSRQPEVKAGASLTNAEAYIRQRLTLAKQKVAAAEYLTPRAEAQQALLRSALHKEIVIETLSARAAEQRRKERNEKEERDREAAWITKRNRRHVDD